MSDGFRNVSVPLSKLVPGKLNPRLVKPEREAHRKLVASIRAHGLIEPLLVRAASDSDCYAIIAGNRRYAALREVYRGEDPKIACRLKDADELVASSLSLAENFAREPMHPLDEAETFSSLAITHDKGIAAIAVEFGVNAQYVRQRMKLAALAPAVKAVYRERKIDTSTAEVFSSLPEAEQEKVLLEFGNNLRHSQQLRNYLAHQWIDAKHALFDVATLPESSVSTDLFNDEVRVERTAFFEAQARAIEAERTKLTEEGWSQVLAGPREELYSSLASLDPAERMFDAKTTRKLQKLAERREQIASTEIEEGDEEGADRLSAKLETLATAREALIENAPVAYSEPTKAVGTVFLMVGSDGSVKREYRVARVRQDDSSKDDSGSGGASPTPPAPPTSERLSDRQLSAVFAHHTLVVREAVLKDDGARKRVLALLLHEKVRSEALAVRPDTNGVTLEATVTDGFSSPAFDRLREKRSKVDPLAETQHIPDYEAYRRISELSRAKLDTLIELLIVDALTCHPLHKTELIHILGRELEVDFRKHWRPDAKWLASFQKAQLTHLLAQLYGPSYDHLREQRKKSELVAVLDKLFTDAVEGTLEDKTLAERVNGWLPSNLREPK